MEFYSIEEMKSKVILGIFSKEQEAFNLPEGPTIDRGEFLLRPLLISNQNSEEDMTSFYVVGREIMSKLGMNETDVLELARQNSVEKHPGEMKTVSHFINLVGQSFISDGVLMPQIYVLTNDNSCCGAAAMFYQPELLDNLAKMKNKDLAVFPADMNCVYCVPVTGEEQLADLQEMYRNASEGVDHILSGNILHYDLANRQLKDLSGNVIEAIQQQQVSHRMHLGR